MFCSNSPCVYLICDGRAYRESLGQQYVHCIRLSLSLLIVLFVDILLVDGSTPTDCVPIRGGHRASANKKRHDTYDVSLGFFSSHFFFHSCRIVFSRLLRLSNPARERTNENALEIASCSLANASELL